MRGAHKPACDGGEYLIGDSSSGNRGGSEACRPSEDGLNTSSGTPPSPIGSLGGRTSSPPPSPSSPEVPSPPPRAQGYGGAPTRGDSADSPSSFAAAAIGDAAPAAASLSSAPGPSPPPPPPPPVSSTAARRFPRRREEGGGEPFRAWLDLRACSSLFLACQRSK
jgi:hypothetical protein